MECETCVKLYRHIHIVHSWYKIIHIVTVHSFITLNSYIKHRIANPFRNTLINLLQTC